MQTAITLNPEALKIHILRALLGTLNLHIPKDSYNVKKQQCRLKQQQSGKIKLQLWAWYEPAICLAS